MITNTDIQKFLSVFVRLSTFEREHRLRCGWGVFNEDVDTLPIPEVMKVQKWLEELPIEMKCTCCNYPFDEGL